MGLLDSILGGSTATNQQDILFASDLHGSNKTYKKYLNAFSYYDVDIFVLGGDLTGKAIVPVVDEGGSWRVEIPGQTKRAETEDDVEQIETQVANGGNYTYRMLESEYEAFREDDEKIDAEYNRLQEERLVKWVEWAEDELPVGKQIYAISGNDDEEFVRRVLDESSAFDMIDGYVSTVEETGQEILGYGYSNPTPWDTPREKEEEELREDLFELAEQVDDWSDAIVNIHVPPNGTHIDDAPKLNENNEPITEGGQMVTTPAGSQAVRDFIEEFEPMLGLHGHIHESQGDYEFDRTLSLNPGSEYGEGYLNGLIITLDGEDNSVERFQFTSG
jgi:Icc-related predicted phosphoesterase